MPKNENRLNRINEELKKEISQIISFELKNPDATGLISITKVKIKWILIQLKDLLIIYFKINMNI